MHTAVAATVLFLTTAVPAQADDLKPYYENANFSVQRSDEDGDCVMSAMFEHKQDGATCFGVLYDAKDKSVTLGITSTIPTSLPDEGKVDLDIGFLDNGPIKYDDGWGARSFSYSKEDGEYMFVTSFTGSGPVGDILKDLAQSRVIAFFYNEKIFTALPLKGSSEAVQKLKDCAFEAAGLNRRDPFAQ